MPSLGLFYYILMARRWVTAISSSWASIIDKTKEGWNKMIKCLQCRRCWGFISLQVILHFAPKVNSFSKVCSNKISTLKWTYNTSSSSMRLFQLICTWVKNLRVFDSKNSRKHRSLDRVVFNWNPAFTIEFLQKLLSLTVCWPLTERTILSSKDRVLFILN